MADKFLVKTLILSLITFPTFTLAAPLFEGPKSLSTYKYEMKISAPFAEMMKERNKEQFYNGELQIRLLGSLLQKDWESAPIKIFVRGTTSLDPEECPFAKLKIEFMNTTTPLLKGIKKLKVGTHCGDQLSTSEVGRIRNHGEAIGAEFMAYKLMDSLQMEHQFVELAQIMYIDSKTLQNPTITRPALLIETEESVASRVGGTEIHFSSDRYEEDQEKVFLNAIENKIDPRSVAMVRLFAAFMGNNDVIIPITDKVDDPEALETGLKNVLIFALPNKSRIAVAQDFDLAGAITYKVAPPLVNCRPRPENPKEEVGLFIDTKVQQLKDIMTIKEPMLTTIFYEAISWFRVKIPEMNRLIIEAKKHKIITEKQADQFEIHLNEMNKIIEQDNLDRKNSCIWNNFEI